MYQRKLSTMLPQQHLFKVVTDGTEFVNILGIQTKVSLTTIIHKTEKGKYMDHQDKYNYCTL